MFQRMILCLFLTAMASCEQPPPHALGTLEWDRVNGRALVSEVITNVYVAEGDLVAEGAPLLQIDNRKILAEIDGIRNRFDRAEWELKERIAGPRPQTIAEERARVESAEVELANTRKAYNRRKELYNKKAVAKEQLDWARRDYLSAQARFKERHEALNELLAGTRTEQVEQSRSYLASLQSQLKQFELQLADYTITAARPGRVDSLPFKLGDRPPVNAVVVTLLSGEQPWARVYVPEPFRSRLIPGQTYTVLVDGRETLFKAKLRKIASDASFTPYYALTEKDRSRLAYVAELDLLGEEAVNLTAGTPVQLLLEAL